MISNFLYKIKLTLREAALLRIRRQASQRLIADLNCLRLTKKILFNKSKKRLKISQIKANLSYYHAYDFKNF